MTKPLFPDRQASHHHGADLFPDFRWDDEKIAYLKKAWLRGDPASTIGACLGCSRSAVLGKLKRLAMPARGRDIARTVERKVNGSGGGIVARVKAKKERLAKPQRAPHGITMAPIGSSLAEFNASIPPWQCKTLVELTPETCRFPLWNDDAKDGFYCGALETDMPRRPYCAQHERHATRKYDLAGRTSW